MSWLLFSCSDEVNDDFIYSNANHVLSENTVMERDSAFSKFAQILSAAVYDSKDVREFLKNEALKKFDKNYDVLFLAAKDEMIGDKTFKEVLSDYAPEGALDEIEKAVPLINIYLTRTAFLEIFPEDLDVDDQYTPVAFVADDSVNFFSEGRFAFAMSKGEVPGFHVFVVGENQRVEVDSQEGNKNLSLRGFRFKDESFDGTKEVSSTLKSVTVSSANVGKRAIDAYKYFYSDDASIHQKGLQRDYIYYGLTPGKATNGYPVRSVSEYIGTIRVPLNSLYKMSDQRQVLDGYADPYIVGKGPFEKRGGGYTYDELVSKVWSEGAFVFKFEVITSDQQVATYSYIPLTPEDLWVFSYTHTRKHSTWFHRSRHTYTIHFDKFEPKTVVLKAPVNMGKWNIKEEALHRYVRVFEEDKGIEVTATRTYDMEKISSESFTGDIKNQVGLTGDELSGGSVSVTVKTDDKNTEKETVFVTEKWTETSDDLGCVKIYYYDPVIESMSGSSPVVKTYSTGLVEFGIFVK